MRIQNIEGKYTIPSNLSLHSVRTEGIIVECNTANYSVTVTLPPLTAYPNVKNLKVIVVDASGDCATNNITVKLAQEEAATTIDGELSWTIDNASDAVVFSRVTEDDWTASKQVLGNCRSFVGYIEQTSTNAPVIVHEFLNELGDISTAFVNNGQFSIISDDGNFVVGKTYVNISSRVGSVILGAHITDEETCSIIQYASTNGVFQNGMYAYIEIKVYN